MMWPDGSSRQQAATAFGRGGMHQRIAGMSPHKHVRMGTASLDRGAPFPTWILVIEQPYAFFEFRGKGVRNEYSYWQIIITMKYVNCFLWDFWKSPELSDYKDYETITPIMATMGDDQSISIRVSSSTGNISKNLWRFENRWFMVISRLQDFENPSPPPFAKGKVWKNCFGAVSRHSGESRNPVVAWGYKCPGPRFSPGRRIQYDLFTRSGGKRGMKCWEEAEGS